MKISKCCYDPYKIHKKCFYCFTPIDVSLENVQCRKKIMQMPVEVPVEQSISSTSEEEQLKSSDTTASRPAKSSDKAEDLQLLGSFLKIFCFSDLF